MNQSNQLIFSEHMKRISYFTDESLRHSQEEKFDACREDLVNILTHANEAIQQVYNLIAVCQGYLPPCYNIP